MKNVLDGIKFYVVIVILKQLLFILILRRKCSISYNIRKRRMAAPEYTTLVFSDICMIQWTFFNVNCSPVFTWIKIIQ